jgi:hypothetical protein
MFKPRSRIRQASGILLVVYLGLFLTFLPGLHDHHPCHDCRGDALDPSRLEEGRIDHAACHDCTGGHEDDVHSPCAPKVGEVRTAHHDSGPCVACSFLRNSRLFVVVTSVPLEEVCLREILPTAPDAPDRLPSSYRRLPRGPPSA